MDQSRDPSPVPLAQRIAQIHPQAWVLSLSLLWSFGAPAHLPTLIDPEHQGMCEWEGKQFQFTHSCKFDMSRLQILRMIKKTPTSNQKKIKHEAQEMGGFKCY